MALSALSNLFKERYEKPAGQDILGSAVYPFVASTPLMSETHLSNRQN
jgi:hypothetical protein